MNKKGYLSIVSKEKKKTKQQIKFKLVLEFSLDL